MVNLTTLILSSFSYCYYKRHSGLRRQGYYTEPFSYLVVKKGPRPAEGMLSTDMFILQLHDNMQCREKPSITTGTTSYEEDSSCSM